MIKKGDNDGFRILEVLKQSRLFAHTFPVDGVNFFLVPLQQRRQQTSTLSISTEIDKWLSLFQLSTTNLADPPPCQPCVGSHMLRSRLRYYMSLCCHLWGTRFKRPIFSYVIYIYNFWLWGGNVFGVKMCFLVTVLSWLIFIYGRSLATFFFTFE